MLVKASASAPNMTIRITAGRLGAPPRCADMQPRIPRPAIVVTDSMLISHTVELNRDSNTGNKAPQAKDSAEAKAA